MMILEGRPNDPTPDLPPVPTPADSRYEQIHGWQEARVAAEINALDMGTIISLALIGLTGTPKSEKWVTVWSRVVVDLGPSVGAALESVRRRMKAEGI